MRGLVLESEPHVQINFSVAGAAAATGTAESAKASKTSGQAEGLAKIRRGKITNRRSQIHMIKKILSAKRDGQRVFAGAAAPSAEATGPAWASGTGLAPAGSAAAATRNSGAD